MELFNGRPSDNENRLLKEIKVYDLLDELQIPFERVDHAEADTMEICSKIDTVLGTDICKNLFLCNRQKTDFYLLMMPSNKPFKTKDITKQLGCSRLSFAGAEYMEQYLNIKPGSVSVLGLMNDTENNIQLVIDKEVIENDTIGCHPCVNTSSLKIKTNDILNKFLPAVHHSPIIVELPKYEDE